MDIAYRWIEGRGDGFALAQAIRAAVFVEEQGYAADGEFDEQDANSLHIVALVDDTPLATARLFETAPGEYHIGRVAVLPEARGKKLGLALMKQALEKAWELGAAYIVLGAQYDKTRFYEHLGFLPTGEKFLDEGYPHVMMRLDRTV